MAITVRRVNSSSLINSRARVLPLSLIVRSLIGGGLLCIAQSPLYAANWDGGANLSVSGIYSDNISLSLDNKQDEFITQITPGLSLRGEGGRVRVSADYALQTSYYKEDDSKNGANHRLALREQAELVEDTFFFNSSASVSQEIEQPGGLILLDTANLTNGENDVRAFQVHPYFERELGSLARAHLGYQHGWTQYESQSASDAQVSTLRGELGNGHSNALFHWSATHTINKVLRENAIDSERQATTGVLSYRVFSTVTAIARGGREENVIATRNANRDGSYWSAGLRWVPGPKFSLEMTKGENEERAVMSWAPQTRTSLNLSYANRDVGLNDSATWSGQLSHNTRRSTWSLNYSETVTNLQTLVLGEQRDVFFTTPDGGLVFDAVTGQPVILTINVFEITDEEFLRANGQGTVSYRTGKSTLVGSLHSEVRTYEISGREDIARGGTASWNWKFASRTSTNLSVTGQRSELGNAPEPIQSIRVMASVNRSMNHNMNTRLGVSRTESDVAGDDRQAIENRITATFNVTF